MNKYLVFKKGLIGLALLLSVSIAPYNVQAATEGQEKPFKVGVVDLSHILKSSLAAKDIQAQIDTRRQKYQKEISNLEKDLRSAEKEILGLRSKNTEDETIVDKRKDFQQKLIVAQKKIQSHKSVLENTFNNSMNRVRAESQKIIADVADQEGYSMILNQNSVVIAEKSLDITKDVIKRLNKKLPDFKVNWDAK